MFSHKCREFECLRFSVTYPLHIMASPYFFSSMSYVRSTIFFKIISVYCYIYYGGCARMK